MRDCPNYGGNGNASDFSNEMWDLYYPLLLLGWLAAIVAEQVLSVTWNGRPSGLIVAHALLAVTIAVTTSLGVGVRLPVLCH